jgi:hypothetical protein
MKKLPLIVFVFMAILIAACSDTTEYEKGYSVSSPEESEEGEKEGIYSDSLVFETQPSNILLTGLQQYRLTTIYKVNKFKEREEPFIGSNNFYVNYTEMSSDNNNNWNGNFMPGFSAVYGFNMVNIAVNNVLENKQKTLFENPVLVKTLYYPAFSNDTLNAKPIARNYIMVSVYTKDTNKDGLLNLRDLRRFYAYNMDGIKINDLVPHNYSVVKSEYDPANDLMYVFARLDQNNNGFIDQSEPLHVFWVDLNNPKRTGRQY